MPLARCRTAVLSPLRKQQTVLSVSQCSNFASFHVAACLYYCCARAIALTNKVAPKRRDGDAGTDFAGCRESGRRRGPHWGERSAADREPHRRASVGWFGKLTRPRGRFEQKASLLNRFEAKTALFRLFRFAAHSLCCERFKTRTGCDGPWSNWHSRRIRR